MSIIFLSIDFNTKTDDKNIRERDPFLVFISNATKKNVTVKVKSRKSRN